MEMLKLISLKHLQVPQVQPDVLVCSRELCFLSSSLSSPLLLSLRADSLMNGQRTCVGLLCSRSLCGGLSASIPQGRRLRSQAHHPPPRVRHDYCGRAFSFPSSLFSGSA
ncbi:unnamed protein product [Pleuronectes platessa]|uniref:Uncharacterized protein n=1 Tax=Pleuronectes platessa TaxID=8262 RepID=A0A9N7U7K0_PLEPL|nr:unnamed protein product [Pleuronectes platessa]